MFYTSPQSLQLKVPYGSSMFPSRFFGQTTSFSNDAMLKDPLMQAGVYPAPLGKVGISVVDVRDIAEATAIVLTSDEDTGKDL